MAQIVLRKLRIEVAGCRDFLENGQVALKGHSDIECSFCRIKRRLARYGPQRCVGGTVVSSKSGRRQRRGRSCRGIDYAMRSRHGRRRGRGHPFAWASPNRTVQSHCTKSRLGRDSRRTRWAGEALAAAFNVKLWPIRCGRWKSGGRSGDCDPGRSANSCWLD